MHSEPPVKRPVIFAGENPLIMLYRPGGDDLVAVASLWHATFTAEGAGHSLLIWADPEAAARVFASGLDITMIGLDVTHKALLMEDDAERLRGMSRAGRMIAELFDFFHGYHVRQYGMKGSPIHDALAVAHVFADGLVETKERHVAIDCVSELCRGRTVVDIWRRTENAPNAHVGVDVDARRFVELLLERISTYE